ncbi:Polyadenylate-binding protein-interacting protein 1 [Mactra antiquata]
MSTDPPESAAGGRKSDRGKGLRRPHPRTQERLQNGEFDLNDNSEVMTKSKLRAEAQEFVPKFAQENLYEDFQRLVSVRPTHLSAVTTSGSTGSGSASEAFKDAVFNLTSNPAAMEMLMIKVVESLNQHTSDDNEINDIIETLFEQSLLEANFRFTGAKICKYLSNELKTHSVYHNFRSRFLKRCQQEFLKREELLSSNLERLCGLSMFFGELFLVLEVEQNNKVTKIVILRKAIADLLRTLLSQLDDVTVKCATLLIKLTGTALMETKDLDGSFDDIFDHLKTLEKHPSLNKTSHCLINSVLSRVESNFGVDQQPSPQKPVQSYHGQLNSSFNNEPIFYNAQGQPITRDEAGFTDIEGLNSEESEAFLQFEAETLANQQWYDQGGDGFMSQDQWSGNDDYMSQPWSTGMSDYTQWSTEQGFPYSDGDYNDEYSDMDDEMSRAYEDFLRESEQTH